MTGKILIIGNGFIGKILYKFFVQKYPDTQMTSRNIFDVQDVMNIQKFFQNNNYKNIIYAVGIKDIKLCEQNPQYAFDINANSIELLANNINKGSIKFIYISTDYIFDGQKGNYLEYEMPNPKTIYGKSKWEGEKITRKNFGNWLIIRTSGVYGLNCAWFTWLTEQINEKQSINCFIDVNNSPTEGTNLAEMIDDMIDYDAAGIINLCGPSKINRYELYKTFCKYLKLDYTLLKQTNNTSFFPNDLSLNCNLYTRMCGKKPIDIYQGLQKYAN